MANVEDALRAYKDAIARTSLARIRYARLLPLDSSRPVDAQLHAIKAAVEEMTAAQHAEFVASRRLDVVRKKSNGRPQLRLVAPL